MTTPTPSPRIFISYAREQTDFAEKLYKDLKEKGFDLWWDQETISSRGETFLAEIREAITGVDRLILLWSQEAKESPYVRYEWEHALRLCKPVHPVLVHAVDYDDLPDAVTLLDARNFQVADREKELQRLIDQLLEPAIPLAPLHGMKSNEYPPGYVRREQDIAELRGYVLQDTQQPVVITGKATVVQGIGGIGKTVLAQALSNECDVRRRFKDGIFWVSVGKTPEIASLQREIGMALGDVEDNYLPEIAQKSLHRILTDKQVLLVLDNVWQTKHAQAFQVGGQDCRVLVTTRKTKMGTMLGAVQQNLDSLTEDEAMELIRNRVDRKPDAPNPHDATEREIIQLLERHTGAINVVAGRLALRGEKFASKLLQRLIEKKDTPSPFKDLAIEKEDQEYNLWASLMESYEDWEPERQAHFRGLGVIAPDSRFGASLVRIIWDMEDEAEADDELAALQQAGMLIRVEREDEGDDPDNAEETQQTLDPNEIPEDRYKMHDLPRTFARALALQAGDYELVWTRYVAAVILLLRQLREIQSLEEREGFEANPHILYVGDTLTGAYQADGEHPRMMNEFAKSVTSYLHRHREIRRTNWLETGLRASQELEDKQGESLLLHEISSSYSSTGNPSDTLQMYEKSLEIDRDLGDRSGEATTLNNIGLVYHALGQPQQALDFYNQALPIRREVGDKSGEATTLNNIGSVYRALGQPQQALDFYNQALPIRREVGDKSGEAVTLANMGTLAFQMNDCEQAIQHLEAASRIAAAIESEHRGQIGNFLAQVRAQCEGGTLSEEEQAAQAMQELARLYADKGADAVREALQGQAPDEVIEGLIQRFEQEKQAAEMMQELARLYAEKGVEAVRQALQGQAPDEVIEQIIAMFED